VPLTLLQRGSLSNPHAVPYIPRGLPVKDSASTGAGDVEEQEDSGKISSQEDSDERVLDEHDDAATSASTSAGWIREVDSVEDVEWDTLVERGGDLEEEEEEDPACLGGAVDQVEVEIDDGEVGVKSLQEGTKEDEGGSMDESERLYLASMKRVEGQAIYRVLYGHWTHAESKEVLLKVGDVVRLVGTFGDGWGYGYVMENEHEPALVNEQKLRLRCGYVPLHHLLPIESGVESKAETLSKVESTSVSF
jgi:hypothetical protein